MMVDGFPVIITAWRVHYASAYYDLGIAEFALKITDDNACLPKGHCSVYVPYDQPSIIANTAKKCFGRVRKYPQIAFSIDKKHWANPWTYFDSGHEKENWNNPAGYQAMEQCTSEALVMLARRMYVNSGKYELAKEANCYYNFYSALPPMFKTGVRAIPYSSDNPVIISHFEFEPDIVTCNNMRVHFIPLTITGASGHTGWHDMLQSQQTTNDEELALEATYRTIASLAYTRYGPCTKQDKVGACRLAYKRSCEAPLHHVGLAFMKYHQFKKYDMVVDSITFDEEGAPNTVLQDTPLQHLDTSGNIQFPFCDQDKMFLRVVCELVRNQNSILSKMGSNPMNTLPDINTHISIEGLPCNDMCHGIYPAFRYLTDNFLFQHAEQVIHIAGCCFELVPVGLSVSSCTSNGTLTPTFLNFGVPIYNGEASALATDALFGWPEAYSHSRFVYNVLQHIVDRDDRLIDTVEKWNPSESTMTPFMEAAWKYSGDKCDAAGIVYHKPGIHDKKGLIRCFDAADFNVTIMANLSPVWRDFLNLMKRKKAVAINKSKEKQALKNTLVISYGGLKDIWPDLYTKTAADTKTTSMYMLSVIQPPSEVIRVVKDGMVFTDGSQLGINTAHIEAEMPVPGIIMKNEGSYDIAIIGNNAGVAVLSDKSGSSIKMIGVIHEKSHPCCVKEALTRAVKFLITDFVRNEEIECTRKNFRKFIPHIASVCINEILNVRDSNINNCVAYTYANYLYPSVLDKFAVPRGARSHGINVMVALRDYNAYTLYRNDKQSLPLHFGEDRYVFVEKSEGQTSDNWAYSPFHKGVLGDMEYMAPTDQKLLTKLIGGDGDEVYHFINDSVKNCGLVDKSALLKDTMIDWVKYIELACSAISPVLKGIDVAFGIDDLKAGTISEIIAQAFDNKIADIRQHITTAKGSKKTLLECRSLLQSRLGLS